MNYMKQVSQMLGVELDEEFNIEDSNRKYKITEDGICFYNEGKWYRMCNDLNDILTGKYEIIKKPILNEAEKQYLSNVLKPFRDKVVYIIKYKCIGTDKEEEISIAYYTDNKSMQCFELPPFKKGTIYKGMELGEKYSVEDLGL